MEVQPPRGIGWVRANDPLMIQVWLLREGENNPRAFICGHDKFHVKNHHMKLEVKMISHVVFARWKCNFRICKTIQDPQRMVDQILGQGRDLPFPQVTEEYLQAINSKLAVQSLPPQVTLGPPVTPPRQLQPPAPFRQLPPVTRPRQLPPVPSPRQLQLQQHTTNYPNQTTTSTDTPNQHPAAQSVGSFAHDDAEVGIGGQRDNTTDVLPHHISSFPILSSPASIEDEGNPAEAIPAAASLQAAEADVEPPRVRRPSLAYRDAFDRAENRRRRAIELAAEARAVPATSAANRTVAPTHQNSSADRVTDGRAPVYPPSAFNHTRLPPATTRNQGVGPQRASRSPRARPANPVSPRATRRAQTQQQPRRSPSAESDEEIQVQQENGRRAQRWRANSRDAYLRINDLASRVYQMTRNPPPRDTQRAMNARAQRFRENHNAWLAEHPMSID